MLGVQGFRGLGFWGLEGGGGGELSRFRGLVAQEFRAEESNLRFEASDLGLFGEAFGVWSLGFGGLGFEGLHPVARWKAPAQPGNCRKQEMRIKKTLSTKT